MYDVLYLITTRLFIYLFKESTPRNNTSGNTYDSVSEIQFLLFAIALEASIARCEGVQIHVAYMYIY